MDSVASCPVCGSSGTKRLFGIDPDLAGKLIIPNHSGQSLRISEEIGRLWPSGSCEFLSCPDCNFCFAWPFLAGNEEIYSALYYRDFEYPADKWEYSRAIGIIERLKPTDQTTLLEVGAGNGTFLDKVSELLGDKKSIYSTEYSRAGVEEIERKGYRSFSKAVTELDHKEVPGIDIVCMFQVLEHMDDLEGVFSSLNRITNSNAQLIVAVPNGTLRSFYDRRGIHLDVPPIHVGRYSEGTFRYLGNKFGWQINEVASEPQSYPVKVKKFIFYCFARFGPAVRTEQWNNSFLKHLFRYSFQLLLVIRHIRVLLFLARPGTGTSLLVHFNKQPVNQ